MSQRTAMLRKFPLIATESREAYEALRNAVLSQPYVQTVVLDMKEIRDIDAAGLGVLASLRGWAKGTGTEVKLMYPSSLYASRRLSSPLAIFSRLKVSPSFMGKSLRSAVGSLTALLFLKVMRANRYLSPSSIRIVISTALPEPCWMSGT